MAKADPPVLHAVLEKTEIKLETFKDIIQSGSQEAILKFLKEENLVQAKKGFRIHDILWMLKDKAFFDQIIEIFRSRHIYYNEVWKYGFHHMNE